MKKAVLIIVALTACFLAAGFAAEPVATSSEQTSVELYKKTIMVKHSRPRPRRTRSKRPGPSEALPRPRCTPTAT